jgi:hypothetical protein
MKEYIKEHSKESRKNIHSFSSKQVDEESDNSDMNHLNKQKTVKKILNEYQKKRSLNKSIEIIKNDTNSIN